MSKVAAKVVLFGALLSGAIGYYRLGYPPLASGVIIELIGNMMGGGLLFCAIALWYQRGKKRS